MSSKLAPSTDNLLIGRGVGYFDRFDSNSASTGELDLGNIKDAGITPAITEKEHMSTRRGIKEIDKVIEVERKFTCKFVLEEISNENLMLAIRGPLSNWNGSNYLSQTAGVIAAGDPMTITARQNRWVMLTKNSIVYRNVSNVVVKDGATTFTENLDYKIDYSTGRLFTLYDGQARTGQGIYDQEQLTITLSYGTFKYPLILTAEQVQMEGFFRFVSTSPVGPNYEWNIWRMKVKCTSEIKLISDDYTNLSFEGDIYSDIANHPTNPYLQIIEPRATTIIS